VNNGRFVFLGIYRQDHDSVIICIGDTDFRPESFGGQQGELILTLRRVKPRK
jgi:hypothetical protein